MATRVHVIATDRALHLHEQAHDSEGHFTADAHPIGTVAPHSVHTVEIRDGHTLIAREDHYDGREG